MMKNPPCLPLVVIRLVGASLLAASQVSAQNPNAIYKSKVATVDGESIGRPNDVKIATIGNTELTLGYSGDPYSSADALALNGGQMTIRGMPYGYYDTGTLLSIVATDQPLSSSRAGINGGYENGFKAMAGDSDMDMVAFYDQVNNSAPRFLLHNVKYDATHIYPDEPLTAREIAMLRHAMWISTNSIDPAIPTTLGRPHRLPRVNYYGSTILGWARDGSSITVSGWTVPGSGNRTKGQVPGATLDTSSFDNPTVWVGANTKSFANNWVLAYDPDSKGNANSRVHEFEGLEIDQWDFGHQDYQASFHGITIGYTPIGTAADGHHVFPTSDSYDLFLAGPMPTMMKIDAADDSNLIDGNSILLRGPASPGAMPGSSNLLLELDNKIDTDRLRLLTWASRDSGAPGWNGGSLHVGLTVNGTKGQLDGSPMGEMVFNPPGDTGGVGLKGNSKNYGVLVGAQGQVELPQGAKADGPIQLPIYTLAQLPPAGMAGREVFCSDCRKPGEKQGHGTGMVVFDDGHGGWISTAGQAASN